MPNDQIESPQANASLTYAIPRDDEPMPIGVGNGDATVTAYLSAVMGVCGLVYCVIIGIGAMQPPSGGVVRFLLWPQALGHLVVGTGLLVCSSMIYAENRTGVFLAFAIALLVGILHGLADIILVTQMLSGAFRLDDVWGLIGEHTIWLLGASAILYYSFRVFAFGGSGDNLATTSVKDLLEQRGIRIRPRHAADFGSVVMFGGGATWAMVGGFWLICSLMHRMPLMPAFSGTPAPAATPVVMPAPAKLPAKPAVKKRPASQVQHVSPTRPQVSGPWDGDARSSRGLPARERQLLINVVAPHADAKTAQGLDGALRDLGRAVLGNPQLPIPRETFESGNLFRRDGNVFTFSGGTIELRPDAISIHANSTFLSRGDHAVFGSTRVTAFTSDSWVHLQRRIERAIGQLQVQPTEAQVLSLLDLICTFEVNQVMDLRSGQAGSLYVGPLKRNRPGELVLLQNGEIRSSNLEPVDGIDFQPIYDELADRPAASSAPTPSPPTAPIQPAAPASVSAEEPRWRALDFSPIPAAMLFFAGLAGPVLFLRSRRTANRDLISRPRGRGHLHGGLWGSCLLVAIIWWIAAVALNRRTPQCWAVMHGAGTLWGLWCTISAFAAVILVSFVANLATTTPDAAPHQPGAGVFRKVFESFEGPGIQ